MSSRMCRPAVCKLLTRVVEFPCLFVPLSTLGHSHHPTLKIVQGALLLIASKRYWLRAWISQQKALAKQLQFLLGHGEINVRTLAAIPKLRILAHIICAYDQNFGKYMSMVGGDKRPRRASSSSYLWHFVRQCTLPL
jgi:hypothetical protein